MDEKTLQAAAAELERNWLKSATLKELELLEISGRRPDLFEKPEDDDGTIRIVLGYELENGQRELVMATRGDGGPISEDAAELVFRRTRIRSRLGLPNQDCGARKPNPACTCLTSALDALGDEAPDDNKAIQEAARKLHVTPPRKRWKRPKLSRPPTPVAPLPLLALPPGPEPPPPPNPPQERAPRVWRQRGEREGPAHPLSPHAFRRAQDGRGEWMDRGF